VFERNILAYDGRRKPKRKSIVRSFVICTHHPYYLRDEITGGMGDACCMHYNYQKHKILIGRTEGKRPHGRPGRRWGNIKINKNVKGKKLSL
jgi:hypothetical protein